MSINDSIDSLLTDFGIVITRTGPGAYVDGVYVPGPATSTLTCDAVVQPAFNLNRVIGGSNLSSLVDGQKATDVRQLHTRTALFAIDDTHPVPDVLTFQGSQWIVARVEEWDLTGEIHYHCVVARLTTGGVAP